MPSKRDIAVGAVAAAVVLGLSVLAYFHQDYLRDLPRTVRAIGYPAVLIIPFLSSASIFLPLPGPAATFVAGYVLSPVSANLLAEAARLGLWDVALVHILSPVPVGLLAGLGEALGELTGYALGYTGHSMMERTRVYRLVKLWVRRRGWLVVFLVSVIPNPIFDVVGLAAGVLRYPVWLFFCVVLAGKIIKSLAFAFGGALGLPWFLHFLEFLGNRGG